MARHLAVWVVLFSNGTGVAQSPEETLVVRPEAFKTLVNPNCSHCVDEARRRAGALRPDDPVLCWTRGYSEGGAIPVRFFLNTYRVISDSYGVFIYDPDAGYVRGFAPSYRFRFYGWRNGVMVMKHQDGTLYSCLSGVAFEGPRKGEKLVPVPTLASTWGTWMKNYPNAVAYHMFENYQPVELPTSEHSDSLKSRQQKIDSRLKPQEIVLGVQVGGQARAYPLAQTFRLTHDRLGGEDVVLLRHQGTSAAYRPWASQPRKFKAPRPNEEGVSPPDAGTPLPAGAVVTFSRKLTLKETSEGIVDVETGSTWDVAGRAQAGALRGWTLEPIDGVVCKWFAWSAEYPQTEIWSMNQTTPKPEEKRGPDAKQAIKMVAGTAEFLRVLPKPFATVKLVDGKNSTVTLLLDGEKLAKVWTVEPDAEIKRSGWWGRVEQFKPGERVWVWFKLDRKKNPVSVAMLADAMSEYDMHGRHAEKPNVRFSDQEIDRQRAVQRDWLREKWVREGLPGTLTFQHVFSGELEVMLDHEALRWGRSLSQGDVVELTAAPPIKGVVKQVSPWRDRTLVRLVVGELESSELKPGQRIGVKMKPLDRELDESVVPVDLERQRTGEERVEWFLANVYCVCSVRGDICTGQFYTLASCNPNGCGSPNAMRKKVRALIAEGKTDRQIWDVLMQDDGSVMLKPHLLP